MPVIIQVSDKQPYSLVRNLRLLLLFKLLYLLAMNDYVNRMQQSGFGRYTVRSWGCVGDSLILCSITLPVLRK